MRSIIVTLLSLLPFILAGCDKPKKQSVSDPDTELKENTIESSEATPTGLTIVVCDTNNKVLDTVVVPDDQQSRTVKFTLPTGDDQIRVFALGERQHKDLPADYYITGRPDDEKWMGLGYVEAHIEKGVLVAIDGNGFGHLTIGKQLPDQIIADIEAAQPAKITSIETNSEQGGAPNPLPSE